MAERLRGLDEVAHTLTTRGERAEGLGVYPGGVWGMVSGRLVPTG